MNPPRYSSAVLSAVMGIVGLVAGSQAAAQETPPFEGTSIPVPPAQAEPWTVPASQIPPVAVRAMTDLFAAGFSDPRGCEYREVELRRPLGFGQKPEDEALPAHGWVLPAQAGDATRYAVSWDGLVYPLISVGPPADLRADTARILSEQPRPDQTLVKIPLLLRLGEIEPAEKIWQWWAGEKKKAVEDEADLPDPFANLATVWLRMAHERVLRPHLHSGFKLALAYLKLIPDFRAAAEKAAVQRGITVAKTPVIYRPPGPPVLDLTFLDQVPALLADEERRVRENVTNRDEIYAPAIIADKKQRIAVLVRDLEDVEAHQTFSPGYLEFGSSVVVEALVAQGEDAVEPLIDCLENDRRFTRSVDTLRIAGVEEPALVALQGILKTTQQFAWLKTPRGYGMRKLDRPALAAQVREYWSKVRDKTLPQRWFATLSDDSAEPDAWAEVAGHMVLSEAAEIPVGGFMYSVVLDKPVEAVPFRGEILRGETHPSVSELMIKRLRETLVRAKTSTLSFAYDPPRKLAAALAKWDGRNQVETLRWYCAELQKLTSLQKENDGSGHVGDLIAIYLARARMGDTVVLSEYAQWIRTAGASKPGNQAHFQSAIILAPLWAYPDDPAMRELAEWLFADPQSPWSVRNLRAGATWLVHATQLQLMAVPAFRTLLLEQLKSQEVVGQVERTPPDEIKVTYRYGNSGHNDDPEAPPVGFKADLRWGDILALHISAIRGAPAFKPYWPLDRRDRAIEQTGAFLRQYGDRLFRGITTEDDDHWLGVRVFHDAALSFPLLDHPATREDVAAGRAIFSLEGQGERRLGPLPQHPAAWTTLRDYPALEHRDDPITKQPVMTTRFDQDGTIWQAEEVLVDGKWRRYFGFVARNRLAAVPAEEIYFGLQGYSEKIDGWDLRINLAGSFNGQNWMHAPSVRAGDAVPITIAISNRRGIDRAFPKATNAARSASADELGLEVHVAYTPRPRPAIFAHGSEYDRKWIPVAGNAGAHQVDLPVATEILASGKGTPLIQFDLAKWYDLTAPGSYAVTLKFTKGGLFDADANISTEYLEITR